jgi:DNA-directed RNA polymerase subunit omega
MIMKAEFLQTALGNVPNSQILINMVSRRVKQLGQGFRPLVAVDPRWSFMEVALKEIADNKLTFESLAPQETAPTKTRKNTKKKRS